MTYQFDGDGVEQAGGGMANQMKSEAPGSRENAGAKGLIELNEMADSAVDEDVIELTDVFSIPEEEENSILELTDVADEEILDLPHSRAAIEDDRSAGEAALQGSGQEILELGDLATEADASREDNSQFPHPGASLVGQAPAAAAEPGGFSTPAAKEPSSEGDLLDFGDLDLGDPDLHAGSRHGFEAQDAPEEALFLEDQEILDFDTDNQEAAGAFAADEKAAAAQTAGEARGLLDLDGLAAPSEEETLEGDEFSDIFNDLDSGVSAAGKSAGQPAADDVPPERGDIGSEISAPTAHPLGQVPAAVDQPVARAPEAPAPLNIENGEEKFILGAGGIRMREKANGLLQTTAPAMVQAAAAAVKAAPKAEPPLVSPEQVEAALERVVRGMVSDRLEAMLMEVLEKAVAKEIQRIKRTLLAGASGNDTC
jgi:hypothetical protein